MNDDNTKEPKLEIGKSKENPEGVLKEGEFALEFFNKLEAENRLGENNSLKVEFSKKAYDDLNFHAKTYFDKEICGVLLGKVMDREGNPNISIEASVRGESAEEGKIQVTFTQETWNYVFEMIDTYYPDLKVMGWYHSHPGFGVEFSDMDLFVHENFFPDPTQIALVTDPLNQEVAICFNAERGIAFINQFRVENELIACTPPTAIKRSFKIEEIKLKLTETLQQLEAIKSKYEESVEIDQDDPEDPSLNEESYFINFRLPYPERVFPNFSTNNYSNSSLNLDNDCSPDELAANFLINLAKEDLPSNQRFRTKDASHIKIFQMLILHHKSALEAELEGKWDKADFFWKALHKLVLSFYFRSEFWAGLTVLLSAKFEDIQVLSISDELRNRFRNEVLLQSYCMLYNFYLRDVEKIKVTNRAFTHYKNLQRLIYITTDYNDKDPIVEFLNPPARLLGSLLEEKKTRKPLINHYHRHLLYAPNDVEIQNRLGGLLYGLTLAKAKRKKIFTRKRKILQRLSSGVAGLNELRNQLGHKSSIDIYLARLYHYKAKLLHEIQAFSEALVNAQKALVSYDIHDQVSLAEKNTAISDASIHPLNDVEGYSPSYKIGFPFKLWLFSSQNKRLKILVLVALLLSSVVCGLSLYDWYARNTRTKAYELIISSLERNDYKQILEEAERFFSINPLYQNDPRKDIVHDLGYEAFVKWMMHKDEDMSASDLERIERYKKWLFYEN